MILCRDPIERLHRRILENLDHHTRSLHPRSPAFSRWRSTGQHNIVNIIWTTWYYICHHHHHHHHWSDWGSVINYLYTTLFMLDHDQEDLKKISQTGEALSCLYTILLMAVYWMTEALPLPITSMIPMVKIWKGWYSDNWNFESQKYSDDTILRWHFPFLGSCQPKRWPSTTSMAPTIWWAWCRHGDGGGCMCLS